MLEVELCVIIWNTMKNILRIRIIKRFNSGEDRTNANMQFERGFEIIEYSMKKSIFVGLL